MTDRFDLDDIPAEIIEYIPDTTWRTPHDPGTDICLNCPLSQYRLNDRGQLYETCDESGWHAKRKSEPTCLIAKARWYKVSLAEAEEIAQTVSLHPQRRITAWYYANALKERTATNGPNNHLGLTAQDRPPVTNDGQRQDSKA